MREIIEKLRADLATNKVDPLEVAKIVADLLPRSVSFNSIVGGLSNLQVGQFKSFTVRISLKEV